MSGFSIGKRGRMTQAIKQQWRLNESVRSLRQELRPGQPKKFAILAEGLLEDMRRLQSEIEQLTAEIAMAPAGV